MIILLQWIIGALLLQLLFALWNAAQLPKLGAAGKAAHHTSPQVISGKPLSSLSVLLPARDEADNITPCLDTVLACSTGGRHVEIIVLDDRSGDGTGAIAAAAGGDRIRVLPGRDLPEGWMGKSHACAQLAEAAGGDWLLFLDADIRLHPAVLSAALITAEAQGRGLVTGFPRQITGSWLEKLVVPLMNFTVFCHLPIPLVRGSGDPRFVAAHGGFMLIHRDSYARTGGHGAIRGELVDDMAMARAFKRAGEPVTLADLTDYAEMRMYHQAKEVWNGYRKNIYAGLGRSFGLLLAVLMFYAFLYVVPLAAAIIAGLSGQPAMLFWSVAAYTAGAAVKSVSDAAGKQPFWYCFLVPVSMLCLIAIAVSSWQGSRSGSGYEWKGRRYL